MISKIHEEKRRGEVAVKTGKVVMKTKRSLKRRGGQEESASAREEGSAS